MDSEESKKLFRAAAEESARHARLLWSSFRDKYLGTTESCQVILRPEFRVS